jgi:prophage antirepressor-like protein
MEQQADFSNFPEDIFKFKDKQIRVNIDEKGMTWFIGKDVCDALDIVKHRNALARLDEDEKGAFLKGSPGGDQNMTIINESGLYSLVLGSRKKEAKPFKRWVTHEVLPIIRKHGVYATNKAISDIQTNPEILNTMKTDKSCIEDIQAKLTETEQSNLTLKEKYEELIDLNFKKIETKFLESNITIYKDLDLKLFKHTDVGYIIHIKDSTYKYGFSTNMPSRINGLRTDYGQFINILALFPASSGKRLEDEFKAYFTNNNLLIQYQTPGDLTEHTEIFQTNPNHDIIKVIADLYAKMYENMSIATSEIKYRILEQKYDAIIAQNDILRKNNDTYIQFINSNKLILTNPETLKTPDNLAKTPNKIDLETENKVKNEISAILVDTKIKPPPKINQICKICKIAKPDDEFGNLRGGLFKTCKICREKKFDDKKAKADADPNYMIDCPTCKKTLHSTNFNTLGGAPCKSCVESVKTTEKDLTPHTSYTKKITEIQKDLFKKSKRLCTVCKSEKNLNDFHQKKGASIPYSTICKTCRAAKSKLELATKSVKKAKNKLKKATDILNAVKKEEVEPIDTTKRAELQAELYAKKLRLCTTCLEQKDVKNFTKIPALKIPFGTICLPCKYKHDAQIRATKLLKKAENRLLALTKPTSETLKS